MFCAKLMNCNPNTINQMTNKLILFQTDIISPIKKDRGISYLSTTLCMFLFYILTALVNNMILGLANLSD